MFKKLLSLFQDKNTPKQHKKSGKSQKVKSMSTKPRPKIESTRIGELGEHKINIQLDQLPKECKSLSDLMLPNPKSRTGYSQVDHLVISPYCLFVIETKNYNGEIKGGRSDQQWTVNNRFKMYNPLRQNYGHIKAIEGLIKDVPSLRSISMVSFTMRCRFSIDPELRKIQSDELIVYDVELSEFISRKLLRLKTENSEPLFSKEQIESIYDQLSQANIVDPKVRNIHIEKINSNKKSI